VNRSVLTCFNYHLNVDCNPCTSPGRAGDRLSVSLLRTLRQVGYNMLYVTEPNVTAPLTGRVLCVTYKVLQAFGFAPKRPISYILCNSTHM